MSVPVRTATLPTSVGPNVLMVLKYSSPFINNTCSHVTIFDARSAMNIIQALSCYPMMWPNAGQSIPNT